MPPSHKHTPLPADFKLSSLVRHPVKRRTVVVDCDGGCDDALALLLLLADPTIDLVAVTVTYGNVSLQQATYNVQHLLHVLKREEVPVYQGAQHALLHSDSHEPIVTWEGHGKDGFGDVDWTVEPFNTRPLPKHHTAGQQNGSTQTEPTHSHPPANTEHAATILPKLAKQYANDPHSDGLDLVALGPLTNIALAQRLDPTFIPQLRQVHCMAGSASNKGNASYTAEFNAHCDPEAFAILLESVKDAAQLYLYDFDVCDSAGLTWQEFDELLQVHPGTPHTHFIKHTSEAYKKYVSGGGSFVACDAYASAGYLHPAAMTKQSQQVRCCVELHGTRTRGALAIDWYNTDSKPVNMTLVTCYDKQSFIQLLRATTAPEAEQPVRQRTLAMQQIFDELSSGERFKQNNIYLRLMRPSDTKEVAALCSYVFAHYEPLSKRLGDRSSAVRLQCIQGMQQWLEGCIAHDTADLTSVVAVARPGVSKQEVIVGLGFTHSEALEHHDPPDMSDKPIAPIMETIGKLNADWLATYRQQPKNLLGFHLLSVDPSFSSSGIGSKLVQAVMQLAELHGFDDVMADATSASQNCFWNAGWRSQSSKVYDEVMFKGEAVFKGIAPFSKPYPTPAVHLMYKQLQPKHKHAVHFKPSTPPTAEHAKPAVTTTSDAPLTNGDTSLQLLAKYNKLINVALKDDNADGKRYELVLLGPHHIRAVNDLHTTLFNQSEPMTVELLKQASDEQERAEIGYQWRIWADAVTPQVIAEKMSYGVIDTTTAGRELVAYLVLSDFHTCMDIVPPVEKLLTPLRALFSCIEVLEDDPTLDVSNSMALLLIGVTPAINGKGIGTVLCNLCVDTAAAHHYRQVIVDATSASQDTAAKVGFVDYRHVDYHTFEYKGQRPFTGIQPFSKRFPQPAYRRLIYTVKPSDRQPK